MKKLLTIVFVLIAFVASAQSTFNRWFPTSGTDTYTTNITSYSTYANTVVYLKFGNTNTGAATININSIGAANIRYWDGNSWEPLPASHIDVNTVYKLSYNGSYFEMEAFGSSGGGTWGSITGTLSSQTDLQSALDAKVATTRTISTTSPLSGGGDLSANRTLTIADAAADATTKGAATFTAADFNSSSGNISIDYTNGQAASGSNKGFLTSANYLDFSRKAVQKIKYINAQTGTSYTAAATDSVTTTLVTMNNANPNNFVIPTNTTLPFAVGTVLYVSQIGDGVTSIIGEDGTVTLTYEAGVSAVAAKNAPNAVLKTATNAWTVWNGTPPTTTGDLTKTNGTYVTVTLSGTPTDALLNDVNITADLTTTVPVTLGGTGLTTVAAGDMLWGSATNTITARNILNTSPTALMHFKAGTTSASSAPNKYTSGTLMTTPEAGAKEYNGDHYETTSGLNRLGRSGAISDLIADVNNTSTTETDLYTYTTKASTLATNGAKLTMDVSGTFNDNTSTAQLKFYFGGTVIGDTGALTVTNTGTWTAKVMVIRTGTTTARAFVTVLTPTTSTASYTLETDITGLTLTNTNIIKVTGTAGGGGGGSSDITAKMGTIIYLAPASN